MPTSTRPIRFGSARATSGVRRPSDSNRPGDDTEASRPSFDHSASMAISAHTPFSRRGTSRVVPPGSAHRRHDEDPSPAERIDADLLQNGRPRIAVPHGQPHGAGDDLQRQLEGLHAAVQRGRRRRRLTVLRVPHGVGRELGNQELRRLDRVGGHSPSPREHRQCAAAPEPRHWAYPPTRADSSGAVGGAWRASCFRVGTSSHRLLAMSDRHLDNSVLPKAG